MGNGTIQSAHQDNYCIKLFLDDSKPPADFASLVRRRRGRDERPARPLHGREEPLMNSIASRNGGGEYEENKTGYWPGQPSKFRYTKKQIASASGTL